MDKQAPETRSTVAETVSGNLMESVRHAYIRCLEDKMSGKVFASGDINYSSHAIEAYILSMAALEAFIHEALVLLKPQKTPVEVDDIERWDVKQKYLFVPLLLWGKTYDKGQEPYQSFDILVKVRNDFVHYKMQAYPLGEGPSYLQSLQSKGILLPGGGWNWQQQLCTNLGAIWSHNTACAMVQKLLDFADDQTQKRFQNLIEGNFMPILPNASIEEVKNRPVIGTLLSTIFSPRLGSGVPLHRSPRNHRLKEGRVE